MHTHMHTHSHRERKRERKREKERERESSFIHLGIDTHLVLSALLFL